MIKKLKSLKDKIEEKKLGQQLPIKSEVKQDIKKKLK